MRAIFKKVKRKLKRILDVKRIRLDSDLGILLAKAAKRIPGKRIPITPEEAEAILQAYHPDPGNSAYYPGNESQSREIYDLDIIVPVYKVENYLRQCMDSLLDQQTRFSYRVLAVDDGSPDHCGAILDEYGKDPRVMVIHQENQGISGARNAALARTESRYVMFVDSDDFLPDNAVEALLDAAMQNDAALVQGSWTWVSREGHMTYAPIPGMGNSKMVLAYPAELLAGSIWGKVIKASFFRNLRNPVGYTYEDNICPQILYPLIQRAKGLIVGIADSVYCYRNTPGSIIQTQAVSPRAIDTLWVTRRLYRDRAFFQLTADQACYNYILGRVRASYSRNTQKPEEIRQAIFVWWRDFLLQNFDRFHGCNIADRYLEMALRTSNYNLYCLVCSLK